MGRPRTKIQRENDRATIAKLHLQGWTQLKIAQHLEVDPATVCRDVAAIQQQWKAQAVEDFELYRIEELKRLSMLEQEYWSGWERSQEGKETTVEERLSSLLNEAEAAIGGSGRLKTLSRKEQRVGEAAFLNGVLKVIEQRSKLLGLYADKPVGETPAEQNLKSYLDYLKHTNAQTNSAASPDRPANSD